MRPKCEDLGEMRSVERLIARFESTCSSDRDAVTSKTRMTTSVLFLGAARNVTGSRHLVELEGVRVLVDCGLYQERQNAGRNWEPFAVAPSGLDAVVLTHAHIDHTGWLPRLVRMGYTGPTYCSRATAGIVPLVLYDAAHLQAEDVANKRRRHEAEGRQSRFPPAVLFDESDVTRACEVLRGQNFAQPETIAPGVSATLLPSGHILGASMVLLEHQESKKRVLFSGDLGRPGRPLVPNPSPPPFADLVVIESTYGDRIHDDTVDVLTQLEGVIAPTLQRGGSVLIPCFAVERAQELLFYLQKLSDAGRIGPCPVFLDSPMAVKLLKVFGQHPEAMDSSSRDALQGGHSPFKMPELHLCASCEESKRINEYRHPSIIIAGSGMCTGGRIKHHLARHLERPESCLLFVGYQATGTLGRQLLERPPEVRLFGRFVPVSIQVAQVHGFSGHADRNELLDWLAQMPNGPRHVAVVHGGTNVAASFADQVLARFDCPVVVPEYGQRVVV
jgi:metallo-beta-lactamase family protein